MPHKIRWTDIILRCSYTSRVTVGLTYHQHHCLSVGSSLPPSKQNQQPARWAPQLSCLPRGVDPDILSKQYGSGSTQRCQLSRCAIGIKSSGRAHISYQTTLPYTIKQRSHSQYCPNHLKRCPQPLWGRSKGNLHNCKGRCLCAYNS